MKILVVDDEQLLLKGIKFNIRSMTGMRWILLMMVRLQWIWHAVSGMI